MLSTPRPDLRPQRQRSLRREYQEFILQRIEEYKDHLSRPELLALADEAVRELEVGTKDQLVLTEVLMLEHVDRLIMEQLKLPTFRRWQAQHRKKREGQRKPSYWGLERDTPLTDIALRLDAKDRALVVGEGGLGAGLFLATHEWPVLFVDPAIASVESAESRAATEGLGNRVQALVVSLGDWFPPVEPTLTIIDLAALEPLDSEGLITTVETLKNQSPPGAIHYVLAPSSGRQCKLSPRVLRVVYREWKVDAGHVSQRTDSFLVVKP